MYAIEAMTAELKTGKANQDPAQQSELQANMAATQTMGARERELAPGAEGLPKRGAEPQLLLPRMMIALHCNFFTILRFHQTSTRPLHHKHTPKSCYKLYTIKFFNCT